MGAAGGCPFQRPGDVAIVLVTSDVGTREIGLCALPPRLVSPRSCGGASRPLGFGAVRGCQWPHSPCAGSCFTTCFCTSSVTFKSSNDAAKSRRRTVCQRYPCQDFAEHWCRELWSQPFDHPDPVHRPPSPEEIEALRDGWRPAHRAYKQGLLYEKRERYEEAVSAFRSGS